MGKGRNINLNEHPARWPHEGSDSYGREVQIVKDEIPTRIDCVNDSLVFLGWAEFGELENEPYWKIRKIEKIGTVWEQRYAVDDYSGPNQFYRFKWSDRYSLTYL
jgi:hypothetical protein